MSENKKHLVALVEIIIALVLIGTSILLYIEFSPTPAKLGIQKLFSLKLIGGPKNLLLLFVSFPFLTGVYALTKSVCKLKKKE